MDYFFVFGTMLSPPFPPLLDVFIQRPLHKRKGNL